jgi:hypothetical protein
MHICAHLNFNKEEEMCESVEKLTELMALKDDYLKACELHRQAVTEGRSKAEIEPLSKRVLVLHNAIQDRIHSDSKVIRFESSQVPSEVMARYARL